MNLELISECNEHGCSKINDDGVVSYASIAELKAYDASVTASDGEIQAALDFATALVNARARRDFSSSSATAVTVNDARTRKRSHSPVRRRHSCRSRRLRVA